MMTFGTHRLAFLASLTGLMLACVAVAKDGADKPPREIKEIKESRSASEIKEIKEVKSASRATDSRDLKITDGGGRTKDEREAAGARLKQDTKASDELKQSKDRSRSLTDGQAGNASENAKAVSSKKSTDDRKTDSAVSPDKESDQDASDTKNQVSGSNSGSGSSDSSDSDTSGSNSGSGSSDSSDSDTSGSNSGSGSSGSSDSDNSGSNSGSGSSGSSDSDDGGSNSGSGSSGSSDSDDGGDSGSNSGSGGGIDSSSSGMQGLAARERPEFDPKGFPVRRGELIALSPSSEALQRLKARGFRLIRSNDLRSISMPLVRLQVPHGLESGQALAEARTLDPDGIYDFDHYYGAAAAPGAVAEMPAPVARKRTVSQAVRTKVGVIDTRILAHPELKGIRIESRDFSGATTEGQGSEQGDHGLAVASILASQGIKRIYSANVFRGVNERPYTEASAIAAALNWMAEQKIPVINISIAGPANALLDRVVMMISARGHVIVAAAGNNGPAAPPAYPAASQGAIAVTAVDKRGKIYRYANRGAFIRYAAAGVDIVTAASGGASALRTGTSFAAPVVSVKFAACLKDISPASLLKCLDKLDRAAVDLGAPGRDAVYGQGLLSSEQ